MYENSLSVLKPLWEKVGKCSWRKEGINTDLPWWLELSLLCKCQWTYRPWNSPLWLWTLRGHKLQIVSSLAHSLPLSLWHTHMLTRVVSLQTHNLTRIYSAGRCDLTSLGSTLNAADWALSLHTTVLWKNTVVTKYINIWWLKRTSTWACLWVCVRVSVVITC